MELDAKDIRIDTYRNSSPEVSVKLIHMPTGIVVQGTGVFEFKLRKILMTELTEKVSAALGKKS